MAAHIIVADDDPVCLFAIAACLRAEGYRVSTAGNGVEAIAADRDDPADVLISDINMPVMDGYALCMEMEQRTRHIPLLLISTIPIEERPKVPHALHLVKPFRGAMLATAVSRLLAGALQPAMI